MWRPIFMRTARTVGTLSHLRSPQTLNDRIVPESAGVSVTAATVGATGAAAAFAPCSRKSPESSGVVLAEKGTSTYSICEPVVFAGTTAESPVTRGSTTVHDPTARFSCAPLPVQAGRASVGPSSLHPAATSNDRPIPHKLFDIAVFLRDFSGAHQRRAEADGSGYLVNTNHRHDQGLKGDPPFRERPPGELRQPQRHPRL